MSAAYGIMPSSNPSAGTDDLKSRGKKAIEKLTGICYKILALQENVTAGIETQPVAGRVVAQTGAASDVVMEGESLGMGVVGLDNVSSEIPAPFTNLDDMSSWTWTDFWAFDMLGET